MKKCTLERGDVLNIDSDRWLAEDWCEVTLEGFVPPPQLRKLAVGEQPPAYEGSSGSGVLWFALGLVLGLLL